MSRFLRRHALGLVAIFLVLSSGAYAISKQQVTNADLATGAVDTRTLAAGAVEGRNFAKQSVGTDDLKLDKLTKYLQSRVNGTCPDGQKVQGILADGSVLCVDDTVSPGTIAGITTSGGVSGGGATGTIDLGLDPAAIQKRISGNCPANQAIDAVAQDGSVGCKGTGTGTVTSVGAGTGLTGGPITSSGSLAVDTSVVQQRLSQNCSGGGAITDINVNGTVNCATVDVTEHSGYVQLNDNPSQQSLLLNFGGFGLRATCLSGGNAQIQIEATGGAGQTVNYEAETVAGGGPSAGLVGPGSPAIVRNTATNDLGRFNVTTSTGHQIDGTFLMWAIATTGGVDCVFNASALAY